MAVDKPAAVAAHASVGWTGPTVLGGLAAAGYRITTSGVHERQGIVHRLDVGTSGVMVVAISERAYTALKRAFKERTVDKRYHALVQGHPDPSSGTIDAPIGRHHGNEWKFAVTKDGRHSITHYDTVEAFVAASLLDVHLETGRTHQIRVHFSALHHPCCGDLVYGADPKLAKKLGLQRQWLHARSLAFAHPADGRRIEIVSPYPQDLQHALDVLRATRADARTQSRLACLNEDPHRVRDERSVGLDALVQFAQLVPITVHGEVRHRPNHLAQEVDNGADVEELGPLPLHPHVDDPQPGGLRVGALHVRMQLGPFLWLRPDEVFDQL